MNRLWFFNPENDIALAADTANFTAPPAAIELRRAGELLPMFLSDDSDAIACNGVNGKWFDDFRSRFNIKSDIWNHNATNLVPVPWGWSKAVRHYFENLGFSKDLLPSDALLEHYRDLSHRHTTINIHDFLATHTSLVLWPHAIEVSISENLPDVIKFASMASCSGRIVAKSPWSSSGRGVRIFDMAKNDLDKFARQCAGTIRRQGAIMIEPYMDNHLDFALLFDCYNGKAEFIGPSVFISDEHNGNYIGNLVSSDAVLREKLNEFLSDDILEILIKGFSDAISEIIASDYTGPVGIDVCCTSDSTIHICETNLRYTMGFVARGIARHISAPAILSTCIIKPGGAVCLTPPGNKMSFYLNYISES